MNNWGFVLNRVKFDVTLPFELATGCILNKANEDQVKFIKERIDFNVLHYEYETIRQSTNEVSFTIHHEQLQESNWRYYIVSTQNEDILFNMHYASNISDAPLDILAFHCRQNGGWGYNPQVLHNYLSNEPNEPAKNVEESDLVNIKKIYYSYIETTGGFRENSKFPEINRAIQMYDSLRLLPHYSDFHVLGLFAIIEMLITHNPYLQDRGDSITHQIASKIPLLINRFEKKFDLQAFFPQACPEKKIWQALYQYRSCLAHGGEPDFNSGLKKLKNVQTVKRFLIELTKAILRHSLKEPQLYKDLRHC